jgi:hypothetical protein
MAFKKIIGAGAASVLLTAAALYAGPPASNTVGPNIRMNAPQSPMPDGRLGRSPQAIVGDPTGTFLVAAWETMQGTCANSFGGECKAPKTPGISAIGVSTDGGKTWIDQGSPYLGGNAMTSGRPGLDRGGVDNQTYFLISRATYINGPKWSDDTPGGSNQVGLLFYRGRFKNGVLTWTDQHLFEPRGPLAILRSPSILAAKDGSGRVWMAICYVPGICGRRGASGGQIEVYSSPDEGKTWGPPVLISPEEFTEGPKPDPNDMKCGDHGAIQILPEMALGSGGELYVTWQHGPTLQHLNPIELDHSTGIRFARSLDGGRTFSAPKELALVHSMRENPPVGYSKTTPNDMPRVAVAKDARHRGRIYVAYTSAVREVGAKDTLQVPDSSQIFLIHSDDKGTTWSPPVPVSPPVPPVGVKRLWPTLTVHDSGAIDIVYMETLEKQVTPDPDDLECQMMTVAGRRRDGKLSSLADVYWVQSTDGGDHFGPPVRVTTATSNWCKTAYDWVTTQFANFGDILGAFTAGERTFAVWTDGRDGVPDAYLAELGVRRTKTAKPAHN